MRINVILTLLLVLSPNFVSASESNEALDTLSGLAAFGVATDIHWIYSKHLKSDSLSARAELKKLRAEHLESKPELIKKQESVVFRKTAKRIFGNTVLVLVDSSLLLYSLDAHGAVANHISANKKIDTLQSEYRPKNSAYAQ